MTKATDKKTEGAGNEGGFSLVELMVAMTAFLIDRKFFWAADVTGYHLVCDDA